MSRGGFKINRCCNDQHEQPSRSSESNTSDWMREFVANAESYVKAEEERQKEAVTVVNKSRERQDTVYDQMHAIMNGKRPLYSSVDEAVSDYQQKTGLKTYLEKIQAESSKKAIAAQIIAASDEGDDQKKKIINEPKLFESHPYIKNFIENVIQTNPSIQIPAIIYSIAQNFERENISSHLDDPDLLYFINSLLKPSQHDSAYDAVLGRGVGLQEMETPENRDPFHILRNTPFK